LDRKLIGIFLIALLSIVSFVSLNYFISGQLNRTSNVPSQTPTPTPEPTPTPTLTPSPSPSEKPDSQTSISKPSVPEVTVTLEAHPYDVPPTYSVNRYTGETVMTSPGYHVENKSVVVRITGITFTSYTSEDGHAISLSYTVRAKGHYEESWSEIDTIESPSSKHIVRYYAYGKGDGPAILQYIPSHGEVDFQVEARIGYYTDDMTNCRRYFTGETSGWRNTQTITFP
jgi:hypothetical protein